MECPACRRDNRAEAAFCSGCGTTLGRHCPQCGTDVAASARFCDACGRDVEVSPPSKDPSAPLPSAFAGGRYQVRRLLGEGAKKRVYLAHDTRLERDVALAIIKTEGLDEAGLARVRREARAMGRLGDHPHVVTVYDVGDEDKQVYIVSQFMAGGSIEDLVGRAEKRQLPVEQVVRLADQVCRALEHAHARGIVHRDVKPSNVWLTEDGTAKLGDFGLAVALDRSRLTVEGMMVGTVAYMPPEQALGHPPDVRSDLYGLGATVYEMLTGRPPFLGDDAVAIISQHINTPPVAPTWHNSGVPRALEALVLRLLAKAPEERPDGAAAVRQSLAGVSTAAAASAAAGSADEPNPLDRLAGGVFVGREREMDELRAGLEETLSGHGRLMLLVGEPGIGKTRTAEELVTYARLRKAQVLWGRCYEGEGAPAYWPWVQAIRAYVHEREPRALLSEMGSGASDIAQMVSEVREILPGLPPPPHLDAEQARFRLFDGVTNFLKNAAKGQPLVLVLDDLHWADRSSLLLLQFLARELRDARILVVGTYRDVEVGRQHPLSQTLAELAREQLSRRVLLRGLTERDVARFIEITAGVKPPAALVETVHRETEGNPFFLNEVVRLLVTEGRLERLEAGQSWSVDIPEGVRAVVGRRLDRLSPECNRVLAIASVVGREFELVVLERLTDLDEDHILDVLEEAAAARVIAEVPGPVIRYAFSHALVRDTLANELTPTRRARLHRRIGETLEAIHGGKPDAHLAELAYHFLESARFGGDVDKAIDYAARAGERATASLAYEEAVEHYERAVQALETRQPPDERRRCTLLLDLGEARDRAGNSAKAKENFLQGAELARRLGAPEHLARAALCFVGRYVGIAEIGKVDHQLIDLLEEALEALPAGDSPLRARLLGRLATETYFLPGSGERREVLSRDALDMARRLGDPGTLADALRARHIAVWGPENVAERRALAEQAVRLGEESGDTDLVMMARWWLLADLLELGDMHRVDVEFQIYETQGKRVRDRLAPWSTTLHRAMRALLEGRLEEAGSLIPEAFAVGQQGPNPETAMLAFGVQMATLAREQGRMAEIEPSLRAIAEQYPAIPGYRWGVAFLCAELKREAEARAEFERLAADDFLDLERDGLWLATLPLVTETCVYVGDTRRAAILYDLLLPFAERSLVHGFGILCWGSATRVLALLATSMGRLEEAVAHFEAAIRWDERIGARTRLTRTQAEYAAMLLDRGRPGDREQALALVTTALATAQAIGQKTVVEHCLALKLKAQGIVTRDVRVSIDAVMSLVERERPDLRRHAAPDGTVTILFTDIEGSTAITERLGDRRAQEVLHAHNRIVRDQIRTYAGFEVKSQGDGFMVAFQSARRAVQCAIALQQALAAYGTAHPETPLRVRIGLHTGEAIKEADDFFGKAVILAARIAAEAKGGEILVSSLLKEITDSAGDISFGTSREVEFQGLSGAYGVYSVPWAAGT